MTIGAALIRDRVLHPTMEATAHNLQQYDPTPEDDSFLEHIRRRVNELPVSPLRTEILALVEANIESNVDEGSCVKATAGFADQLAQQLHRIETAGIAESISTKALTRKLRDPLKVVRCPAGRTAREITEAHMSIKDVVARHPSSQVLTDDVRRDLGEKLTVVLERYVESHWRCGL